VLGAVRVPRRDLDDECALDNGVVGRRRELRQQRGIAFDDPGLSPDLHAALVRVVDQKEVRLRVVDEVAHRDVLAVPSIVGEGEGVGAKDAQEAGRTAAMLNVGLTVGVDRRQKEAPLFGDERRELVVDLRRPAPPLLHAGIGAA